MTAAMVPQGREPILRVNYDSRMGHCGIVRIYREGYYNLIKEGIISQTASFTKNYEVSGPVGIVCITVPSISREFVCVARIQPAPDIELLIYEVEHKHTAGAK